MIKLSGLTQKRMQKKQDFAEISIKFFNFLSHFY